MACWADFANKGGGAGLLPSLMAAMRPGGCGLGELPGEGWIGDSHDDLSLDPDGDKCPVNWLIGEMEPDLGGLEGLLLGDVSLYFFPKYCPLKILKTFCCCCLFDYSGN